MGKRTVDESGKITVTNKRGNGEGTEPKWNEKRKVYECQATLGRTPEGKLYRPVFTAPTRTECREKRDAAVAAYRGGNYIKSKKDTFDSYLQQWLDAKKPPILQPTTWGKYEYLSRVHISPEIGKTPLQKLSRNIIQSAISQKSQKLAPATVREIHMIIKNVCALAVEDKIVAENPCKKIEMPKIVPPPINILSTEEMTKIMTACFGKNGTQIYDVVFLELRTGQRRGEILGLMWSDINFETNEISINKSWIMINGKPGWSKTATGTKTEAGNRVITAPADAMAELQRRRAERPNDVYVFQAKNGLPLNPNVFRQHFKKRCDTAGLKDTRFHDLRHNVGTMLAAAGIHQRLIEAMLGHKDYRSSRRYIHATKTSQQQVANVIGEALKGVKAGCKPVAKKRPKTKKKASEKKSRKP